MTPSDLSAFALELASDTKEYVEKSVVSAVAGIHDFYAGRLAALERQLLEVKELRTPGPPGEKGDAGERGPEGQPGRDGKDVNQDDVIAKVVVAVSALLPGLVQDAVTKTWATVQLPRDGRDGKDADITAIKALIEASMLNVKNQLPDLAGMVTAEVQKAVATIPVPKDGRDGKDGEPGRDGKDGVDGKDGQSIDPAIVDVMVAGHIEKAIRDLPKPKDGRDGIDGKDGRDGVPGRDGVDGQKGLDGERGPEGQPGRDGVDGQKGLDGAPGRDGIGIVDVLQNKDGHLILTLSDGTTKDAGVVAGRDVDPVEVMRHINEAVTKVLATWERPKDGKDGKDGFGFDSMDLKFNQDEGYLLRFTRGEEFKDMPIPVPWDAGTWKAGRMYPAGAGVTDHGAFWIAQQKTMSRPPKFGSDDRSGVWRLAVKPGRDGQPGKDGKDYIP